MKHVFYRHEIERCDKAMIEKGVPAQELINRAALALYEQLKGKLPAKVLILCGKGNNGNDGRALAKLIAGSKIYEHFSDLQQEYDIIIDGIFGTGLHKNIEGEWARVLELVNQKKGLKVAIDMPSGLNCNNGTVMGVCFKADITYTFVGYKYGQLLNFGRDLCGTIRVLDIGIDCVVPNCGFVSEGEELFDFFQKRPIECHKGDFGKCVIIAGSRQFFGAGQLSVSAEIALKTGCGYCYLLTEKQLISDYRKSLPEAIILPQNAPIPAADAIALGMGMGVDKNTLKQLKRVLNTDCRLIIDADGINVLGKLEKDALKQAKAQVVLTPHLKEFSRLSGLEISVLKEDLVEHAKQFSKEHSVLVLLKGATTILTDGTRVCLNIFGTPALAKGGSGDVLSGVLCAVLARKKELFPSLVAGNILFSKSGERAAKRLGEYSVLASDVIEEIKKINLENSV